MKNFRNPYNFKLEAKDLENKEGKSLTVPDQSFTVQEILLKFTSGIPLNIGLEVEYEGDDPSFDDIDETRQPDFDLADATNALNQIELQTPANGSQGEEANPTEQSGGGTATEPANPAQV